MKKKIGLGIIAVAIAAGAFVYVNNTKQASMICPDRPGCVCSVQTSKQVAKPTATASIDKKETCPNKPGCICK